MVGEQGRRGNADGNAVGIDLLAPVQDVLLGELHGRVDAVLVHDAHLAVDHRAQAELVHGRAGGAGQRDVGHRGDAAGESVQAAQNSGVEPVGSFHAPAFLGHFREPLHIGRVVHHAAQHRLLEAGVQVNQAGHDGGQTLVDDLFLGVAQAQLLGLPDVANDAVAHEDRAIDDGLGRNRQDILGTQKHGTSQFMRGVFN
jgi:hypothetical protein